jgi:hypothetical protein
VTQAGRTDARDLLHTDRPNGGTCAAECGIGISHVAPCPVALANAPVVPIDDVLREAIDAGEHLVTSLQVYDSTGKLDEARYVRADGNRFSSAICALRAAVGRAEGLA